MAKPDLTDDLRDSVNSLVESSPVVAAGRGIAKIGSVAQDAYDYASKKADSLVASAKAYLTPKPTKAPMGDIELPAPTAKRTPTARRAPTKGRR